MHVVTLDEVKRLRQKTRYAEIQIHLQHDAEYLWRYVINTDIIDKKVGLSPLKYTFVPKAQGGTLIYAQSDDGWLKEAYQEIPYQWLPPNWFSVERVYSQGILRYFRGEWQLTNQTTGGCILTCRYYYLGRYPFPLKKAVQQELDKVAIVYKEIDQHSSHYPTLDVDVFFQDTNNKTEKIQQLQQAWKKLLPNSQVPTKLAEYIYTAPDKKVFLLRPFEVADYYQLPRIEVLRFCLLATKQGFLEMSWDILCPSCRGTGTHTSRLIEFSPSAHCTACNIQYDAEFENNVEVTFRPNPQWRTLDTASYCAGSPASTPHIWAQLTLDPQEQRQVTLHLDEGTYRFTSPTTQGEIRGYVSDEQDGIMPIDTLTLTLGDTIPLQHTQRFAPILQLQLSNTQADWQVLKIEKLDYQGRIVTAAFVTTLQDFRDLFSSEVLRPGVQLGISNISLLFTDLKSSTELYEKRGDASAFALVQAHFDIMTTIIARYQGGVVKTIGDAVMAVFTDPLAAVQASVDILRGFNSYNQNHPTEEQLIIKLGLHKGACIALNLNEKLDYFGSTVNIAARVQGVSEGNDLILSSTMYDTVEHWLTQCSDLQITSLTAKLKGIQDTHVLYRIQLK
ncbi:family 3 adenylate cyclase [Beggiatoa alba B18LD]|uniref:Family 3 adenylate cyclase n=1 Tax=Beggiatoa alba B18LD TaxID=395493 RepID=I3CFA8_9GAMM|nr:adenylate/guanylate cyclase domain-containing protein [Beggiatoa alba]EIJ42301.1 family 3 adenylate cyclase [Beggiatoa alba B18LD]